MPVTIIRDVRLFDGKVVHPQSTVAFDSFSGNILSVSDSGRHLPEAATIVEGSGHTLLPGLIDAHVHVYDLHLPKGADHSQVLRQPLRCGVTTVCDMHSDPPTIHRFREQIKDEVNRAKRDDETVQLCDIKSALYGATIEGGWPKPIVLGHNPTDELKAIVKTWPSLTPDTAKEFVTNHRRQGADYIKLMQENCCSLALPTNSIPVASVELQKSVIDAAHEAGLLAVGHATSVESTEIVLEAGGDGLTHTFIDQPPSEELLPLYRRNNAFVIPTLVVLSSLTNDNDDMRRRYAEISRRRNIIDDFTRDNMVANIGLKAEAARIEHAYDSLKMFKKHGIDMVAGTDSAAGLKGTAIGPSLWMELDMYVDKCGFTPLEALKSATSVTAERFRFDDRGIVEPGRRADLLLVKGDPTQDLSVLWADDSIAGVWKQGLRAA